MTTILSEQQPGGAGGDLVKDSSTQAFVKDVIEASREVPVLVDFWAAWCGPCRQLTPVIEQAVRAQNGKVRLVKLNIDEHPAIPGQMGVQSIPAVFAFKDGRPIDGFLGALPESQVKAFIARLIGDAGDDVALDLEAADAALAAGDTDLAADLYARILEADRENADAIAGLAKTYLALGDLEAADKTLALAGPKGAASAAVQSAQAALDLARKGGEAGASAEHRQKVEADPNDPQARFDLAVALGAEGDRSGAVEQLLTIVRRHRGWNDDAARKQLVQLFEAWGPKDPATVAGRQQLSSLLFA